MLREASGDGTSQPSSDQVPGHAPPELLLWWSVSCQGTQGAGKSHGRLHQVPSPVAWLHVPHRPSPSQAAARREGDGSCRHHFGAVCPVLGLGKTPLRRRGARPSCLLPHAKPPPHGSRQTELPSRSYEEAVLTRSPTPATSSRHRRTPNGPAGPLTAGFRRTEASPCDSPNTGRRQRRTISPPVSGRIPRVRYVSGTFSPPRSSRPAYKGFPVIRLALVVSVRRPSSLRRRRPFCSVLGVC